jgi:hypothetical protein
MLGFLKRTFRKQQGAPIVVVSGLPRSGTSMLMKMLDAGGMEIMTDSERTADGQVFWRVRADQPGDHVFKVRVGDEIYEKGWAVGGDARKIPVKRLRNWEAVLYPGEAAIPSGAPILSLELDMHTRPLDFVWDGEFGILMWAMVLSLVAGVALKDFFGVTL